MRVTSSLAIRRSHLILADNLSTFDSRLLFPQPLAQAMHGGINWCTAEVFGLRERRCWMLTTRTVGLKRKNSFFVRSTSAEDREPYPGSCGAGQAWHAYGIVAAGGPRRGRC